MFEKLFGFLGVEKKERAPLSLLSLRAAAVAVIIVAAYVYQSAVFLSVFRTAMLPWLYAAVAVFTVLFSFPYSSLHKKWGEKRADTYAMLFFGAGLTIPLFSPAALMYKPTLFIFSIWVKLVGVFAAISFWHHATRAFPSRRAKTILPIVAAGFSLGSALAGKFIQLIAVYQGSATILPILLGAIIINIAIPVKGVHLEKIVRPRKKRGNIVKQGLNLLTTNRLALYLTLFILFTIPVFICTDFILKKAVRANFGKDGMAAFFANYQLYLNLGVFVLQTLLMGRLMRWLGVIKTTLVTPIFLILTFPLLILYPTLTFALVFAVFAGVLRLTVHTNSRNQLITPLSPGEKETASMFLRTIIAPVGTVLTSIALLPLKYSSIKMLGGLSLGMSLLFLFFAFKAARAYNSELLHALKKKTLSFDAVDRLPLAPDAAVLQNLRDRVMSSSFEEASFAVSLLAEYDELKLNDLDSFFKKEFKGIEGLLPRLKAIELGLYLRPQDKQAFFTTIFEESDQPEILMEAARITLMSKPSWLKEYATRSLSTQEGHFGQGIALYILSELDSIPGDFAVAPLLEALVSGDKAHQLLGASIAASLMNETGDDTLKRLMDNSSSVVTSACIRYAGMKKRSALYERILEETLNPQYRKAAFDALFTADLEVEAAERYLLQQTVPQLTVHIIRGLVLSSNPEAWVTLSMLLERGRGWHIALLLSETERLKKQEPRLHEHLPALLKKAQQNFLRLRFAEHNSAHPLVQLELSSESAFWSQVLFSCLRLTHPKSARRLSEIEKSINSSDARQVNAAIELLEDWCQGRMRWLPMAMEKKVAEMEDEVLDAFPQLGPRNSTISLVRETGDPLLIETVEVIQEIAPCSNAEREMVLRAMHLRNSGFFKNLATEIVLEIARMGERLSLDEGEILFNEGDAGDGLYFVMEGALDVLIKDNVVNNLTQGAVLGEIALLDEGPRTATIRGASPSVLIRISPKMFDEMIREYPLVAKQVATTLVGHIRRLVPHIETAA